MTADDGGAVSDRRTADGLGGMGAMSPAGAPTCYRHPKREAHIRCVRCDRPICPDCMITASVGFQCPECVRGGNATQRVARTALGGRMPSNTISATYVLIAINIVAFLIEAVSARFVQNFELIGGPVRVSQFDPTVIGVAHGEYYRLLTAMFLHEPPSVGGTFFLHILFNMWALYVVGPPVEAVLGKLRFVVLYLLAGLSGSALAYWLAAPYVAELGASGAIFGLFAALFVFGRRMRFNIGPIGAVIGFNLLITFTMSGISWQAHVGGLVGGAALAAAWAYAPRKQRTIVQWASSIALALIIVAIVAARTHSLTHG